MPGRRSEPLIGGFTVPVILALMVVPRAPADEVLWRTADKSNSPPAQPEPVENTKPTPKPEPTPPAETSEPIWKNPESVPVKPAQFTDQPLGTPRLIERTPLPPIPPLPEPPVEMLPESVPVESQPLRVMPTPVPEPAEELDPDAEAERDLLLGAARNAIRQGDLPIALARFEELFRRYGENAELRQEYAGILVRSGRGSEALDIYRRLSAADPGNVDLRVTLGDVALLVREYGEALRQYLQALQLRENDPDIAVRLARTNAFVGDHAASQRVFDRYLSEFQPGHGRTPTGMPSLLIEMYRPADALAFLEAGLIDGDPGAKALGAMARAYAMLCDRPAAARTLERLFALPGLGGDELLELGDALVGSQEFEMAIAVYGRLLSAQPDDVEAKLGMAKAHLGMYDTAAAHAALAGCEPSGAVPRREYWLTLASCHRIDGEYSESKQCHLKLLTPDPADHVARLSLAKLYQLMREDEKAKAEYAKIPPATHLFRDARLGIAQVLTLQWRFDEALAELHRMRETFPDDGPAVAQLARTLTDSGDAERAVSVARAFLAAHPKNRPARLPVVLALGRALLEAGRSQEAGVVYEELLNTPGGRLPATHYGLYRAETAIGRPDVAAAVLAKLTSYIGGDARERILLADLFANDYDDHAAAEMLAGVLKWQPHNLAAMTRLADAQTNIAIFSGDPTEAMATARAVLDLSPTNVAGRLVLARTLSIAQDWERAAAEYDAVIRLDPDFRVPQRQKGRVLYAGHRFGAGASAYGRIQFPDAERQLADDLNAIAVRYGEAAPIIAPYLRADLPGQLIAGELTGAIAGVPDPAVGEAVRRAILDYEARAAEQLAGGLEGKVKENVWRPFAVQPISLQLTEVEPANTANWFDLAQARSTRRQTYAAIDAYSHGLAVSPRERESMIALERAGLELNPQLHLGFDYFGQRGRDGLAQIARIGYGGFLRVPYGDEDEFLDAGFRRVLLVPDDDDSLNANVVRLGFRKKFWDRLSIFAVADAYAYEESGARRNRVNFDAGTEYFHSDGLILRGGLFQENVNENGEALRQDIVRTGFRVGADVVPGRRWLASGTYSAAHYSDSNDWHDVFLRAAYTAKFAPDQLKFVVSADLQSFREQTVFAFADTDILFGTVHPYFSPEFFGFYEARIEWTQWLSRDYFVHSNQCWYSLQYGLAWDNSFINYNSLRAQFNYDVRPWLSVGADAKAQFSDVYTAQSVNAYMIIRFPGGCW